MNRFILPLVLLSAVVSNAQVQVPHAGDGEVYSLEGTVEGKPALAFVLLTRKGSQKIRVAARAALGDRSEVWNEVVKVGEPRFVISDPSSVVDRVLGRTVMTTDVVVTRANHKRLELEIQEGGRSLGTLSGDRLDRPGPDPRDWRNHWLLRGPVARWGLARTFWDMLKPGSRGELEFRGESTPALSRKIGARLDLTEELSAAAIFRAARKETANDRAALEASFGFMVDMEPNQTLRYRGFPGIPQGEKRHDKYQHFFVSALLAYRSNIEGSLVVGWAKEVLDMRPGGSGYNDHDLFADLLGASFGHALRFGEVRDY